ncbi:Beta-ketothiolase BktB [Paraburkholderia sediminicola]|uniref:Beta-ketothiolase BktB n=1 Tax=Paraburkholderia sediminicola TaxID=458836 RepID=A0A6J5CU16_9BURK|nr:acetyl-CoA C-acyltransferase family protein [Paraburkholderia sediminicola]CAB3744160.1 Beta-ketothiolase BktB [Paraburkholderia sediminicola]
MRKREVAILATARTAIGSFGGALKDVPMRDLGVIVVKASLDRSGLAPADVGQIVLGNVVPTEPADAYLSRVAAIGAGVPKEATAYNVNRLCGSGLQAIVCASQSVLLGDTDFAIAGGAESMSRGPYLLPAARWGQRMGDSHAVDYMNGILHDPWQRLHMGITAENVAERYGISRVMQDALALESQRRAANAIRNGYFRQQIVPVTIRRRTGDVVFDTDEHVRADVTETALSQMKTVFRADGGTVTAGNASGINDGAAAVVLGDLEQALERGLKPLARLVGYAHAGVEPELMGIGPVPATRLALERTGLSIRDIDVVEANEAFAAQACAVTRELGLDPARVNVHGSGISLGHPVGATGAIITVKAIAELHRTGGRYALVTMCIGGGQGIAAIFERL